jgi:hypothetical protein
MYVVRVVVDGEVVDVSAFEHLASAKERISWRYTG